MDFMEQILEEVEALAISNSEKGVGADPADVALGMFFDGAEDLNTRENRIRVHMRYSVTYKRHARALAAQ